MNEDIKPIPEDGNGYVGKIEWHRLDDIFSTYRDVVWYEERWVSTTLGGPERMVTRWESCYKECNTIRPPSFVKSFPSYSN